jgi:F420-0:gamma-glutamyl ligase-like protein
MIAGSSLRNAWTRHDRKDQTLNLSYGRLRDSSQTSIYAIRIRGAWIQSHEADEIAERMRERMAQRGELGADVVVIQGDTKNTLRLFGTPYSVNRVRVAMFNAAIRWMPLDLG